MTVPAGVTVHTLWSEANRRRLAVFTWLPRGATDDPLPLVVLLHGVMDAGGHVWLQEGHAQETCARLVAAGELPPFALVIASDTGAELGTGYCDWADGTAKAETHLIGEVLPWAEATLNLDGRRHITGLSMGGYGALLTALRHPGTFAAASSMSGFFDPGDLFRFIPDNGRRMWADGESRAAHDVRLLLADPSRRRNLRIGFDCGRDDVLIEANRRMHQQLLGDDVPHAYAEVGGGHEWPVWRTRLAVHLRFLLGRQAAL